jgi:hypothetical protein
MASKVQEVTMAKGGFRGHTAMLLTGLAIGAGAMYVFDPEQGGRRRSHAGQKALRGGHVARHWIACRCADLGNRAWGAVAELGSSLRDRNRSIPDDILEARVRSQLGHVLSHPGVMSVEVHDGQVTISGNILPGERSRIEDRIRKTRGVRNCTIHVFEREASEGILDLQRQSGWSR